MPFGTIEERMEEEWVGIPGKAATIIWNSRIWCIFSPDRSWVLWTFSNLTHPIPLIAQTAAFMQDFFQGVNPSRVMYFIPVEEED
jgi:hypothetical protein